LRVLLAVVPVVLAAGSGCRRPQPCDGNTCSDHGTCRVLPVEESGPARGRLERHVHYRRVEVCDCDGEDGFEYRPVGCGPAAKFSTCLPQPCSKFSERCRSDEVCVPRGLDEPPVCEPCPEGQEPTEDAAACTWPDCLEEPPDCGAGLVCGRDGACVPCPEDRLPAEDGSHCRPCPGGFVVRDGACEPLYGRGYLVTRLQVNAPSPPDVVGNLNGNDTFRYLWNSITEDGYNMIWDQDLILVFFFPDHPDGQPPAEEVETALYVYEAQLGLSALWVELRGPEAKRLRDPRRPLQRENYLPGEPTGEECVRQVELSCNPGHFNGDGIAVERHETRDDCSPTLARLKVTYGWDRIRTVQPNWLLMPYAKYGFIFQTQQFRLRLERHRTGLCEEDAGDQWPCTGYEGWVRAVVRAIELFEAVKVNTGGGLTEDVIAELLGPADVDLDQDGEPDGYTLQFDVNLTPIVYASSLEAAEL